MLPPPPVSGCVRAAGNGRGRDISLRLNTPINRGVGSIGFPENPTSSTDTRYSGIFCRVQRLML